MVVKRKGEDGGTEARTSKTARMPPKGSVNAISLSEYSDLRRPMQTIAIVRTSEVVGVCQRVGCV